MGTKITDYMLSKILDGNANNIKAISNEIGKIDDAIIFGSVKLQIKEIRGNRVLVDMFLLDQDRNECVKYEGAWIQEGGDITFESNADVLIVGRLRISDK